MRALLQHPARAFTIVELLVAVTVAAIALGVAVPSLMDLIHRRRVEAVAQELSSDLALLKAEANKRSPLNVGANIRIGDGAALNCYSMYVGMALDDITCNCLKPPGQACTSVDRPDAELKTVQIAEKSGIKLVAWPRRNVRVNSAVSVSWPMRIRIEGPRKGVLRVDLEATGRVLVCNPAGGGFDSYPNCPA